MKATLEHMLELSDPVEVGKASCEAALAMFGFDDDVWTAGPLDGVFFLETWGHGMRDADAHKLADGLIAYAELTRESPGRVRQALTRYLKKRQRDRAPDVTTKEVDASVK